MESFLGYYIIVCMGMAALMPLVAVAYIRHRSTKIDQRLQELLSKELYKARKDM